MIGRKRQIQELNDLYDSKKAELVAVYGRRRVGKTYLIDETFKDRITFRHAGVSPVDCEKKGMLKKQLEAFFFSLMRSGATGIKRPKSWMEAFFLLESFLENIDDGSRQLVFIDELPWMDTKRSGFMEAFENFWNGWACYHDNLMVIVCGSANSWMLDNLINNHGGLYGRTTYEIKLLPFNLRECELFFEDRDINYSRYDVVQSYMAVGGIPYYLGYFRRGESVPQNIDNLFFSKDAKLRNEFNRLFDSIFEKPEFMKKIVRTLYKRRKGFSWKELSQELGMAEGGSLLDAINALLASEFIEKYVPFNNKKNNYYYRLKDSFCSFYLHFVEGRDSLDTEFWKANARSQSVISWRGIAFEDVCFNHIKEIKHSLGIGAVDTNQSSWNDNIQIDMVIERKDNVINLCEMKFYNEEFEVDEDYYITIRHRENTIAEMVSPVFSIFNTLITTFGIKENKYSNVFSDVVTLEDLFAD